MAAKGFNQKALTAALRQLSSEAVTIDNAGNPITRYEILAKLIWDQALGFTETTRDEEGTLKKIVHKPVAWAQQYLFERLEGKAPMSIAEDEGRVKAADKVRDLAKSRLNDLALSAAGPVPAAKKGPPKFKPKG